MYQKKKKKIFTYYGKTSIVENGGAAKFRVTHLRGAWVKRVSALANQRAEKVRNLSLGQNWKFPESKKLIVDFKAKKSEAFLNAKMSFRPLKILRKSKILVQYESFWPNINSWKGTLNLTMPDTGGLTIMGQN